MKICAREERETPPGGRRWRSSGVLRQLPPPAGPVYTKDIKKTISSITRTLMSQERGSLSLNSKAIHSLLAQFCRMYVWSPTTISVGEKNNLNNISVRKYIVCKQIPPSRVSLVALMDKWARQNSLPSPDWLLPVLGATHWQNCRFHSNTKFYGMNLFW